MSHTTKTVIAALAVVALFACGGWSWLMAALDFPVLLVLSTFGWLCLIVLFGAVGTAGFLGMRHRVEAEDPTPDEEGPEVCITHPDGADDDDSDRWRWAS